MITNLEDFTKRLRSLLKYYHKPTDDFIEDTWFSVCNQFLTDQEFLEGAILCMRRRDFLPPIDEFIKLVKGTHEVVSDFEAAEIWDRIVSFLGRASSSLPEHAIPRRAFLDALPPVYTYALNKVGGLAGLGYAPVDQLVWKRKEFMGFCKSYRQVEELKEEGKARITAAAIGGDEAVKALPQSTLDAIAFDVVDTPERELEPVAAPSRSNGLTSIGDALF